PPHRSRSDEAIGSHHLPPGDYCTLLLLLEGHTPTICICSSVRASIRPRDSLTIRQLSFRVGRPVPGVSSYWPRSRSCLPSENAHRGLTLRHARDGRIQKSC